MRYLVENDQWFGIQEAETPQDAIHQWIEEHDLSDRREIRVSELHQVFVQQGKNEN